MASEKTMLCRCEDITLDDAVAAIGDGYRCFEDLKRFLGVGTGPCQGKSCVQECMRLVATAARVPVEDVDVMTFRPPVRPIPFFVLAAPDAEDRPSPGPASAGTPQGKVTQRAAVGGTRGHDAGRGGS